MKAQSNIRKPKNARSKRAMEARQPKEVEDARIAIFVKGTKTGEVLNGVMKDMVCSNSDLSTLLEPRIIFTLDGP